jgi:hypothetical protein
VTGFVRDVLVVSLNTVRQPDDTPGRARSNEEDLAALDFWPS